MYQALYTERACTYISEHDCKRVLVLSDIRPASRRAFITHPRAGYRLLQSASDWSSDEICTTLRRDVVDDDRRRRISFHTSLTCTIQDNMETAVYKGKAATLE